MSAPSLPSAPHNVRGILFADYVRMIRGHKGIHWAPLLAPEDLKYLVAKIAPDEWYPMTAFERMGNAILKEIAKYDLELVRTWGRMQLSQLHSQQPRLLAEGDPIETLMRFRVLRATYFDFDTLAIPTLVEGHAEIAIQYGMGPLAEEAAAHQTAGFFDALVSAVGGQDVTARFVRRGWAGEGETVLLIEWR